MTKMEIDYLDNLFRRVINSPLFDAIGIYDNNGEKVWYLELSEEDDAYVFPHISELWEYLSDKIAIKPIEKMTAPMYFSKIENIKDSLILKYLIIDKNQKWILGKNNKEQIFNTLYDALNYLTSSNGLTNE